MTKFCSRCGSPHDKKSSWCNPCRADAMRAYRATKKGKEATKRMEANRIVTDQRRAATAAATKQWAARPESKERLKAACKRYRDTHKDLLRVKERARRESDPNFKLRANIRRRLREVFARKGYTKKSQTRAILGCDYEQFAQFIERKFTAGMSWANFGQWELDHIVPISSGASEADIVRLSHYTNLQPLWRAYNRLKSNMPPEVWARYVEENNIDVRVVPNE